MNMKRMLVTMPEPLKNKLDAPQGPGLYRERLHSQSVEARVKPTKPQRTERTVSQWREQDAKTEGY